MGRPRGLLTYLALLCAGGAVAVALPGLAAGTTRAAAPGVYPSHKAQVVGAAVVNFSQLARIGRLHGHVGPGQPATMPEPQEVPEPNMRQLTLPSPFGSQLLSSAGLSNVPSPSPTQSFIAQADAPRPISGFSFIPPDTQGAVGATTMMSTLNSNYVVEQKSNGAVVGSPVGMDTFWQAAGATQPFDPKTYYDPYSQRWIVAAVDAPQSAGSGILYGVSKTSDPSGGWYLFKIDADAGNTTWADYPGVGFNQSHVVITVNMFNNSNNMYAGKAKVYVINYANLKTGANGSPVETDASGAFTIQPAVTYSATESNVYMVEHGTSSGGDYYFYTVNSAGTVTGGTTQLFNPLGGWVQPGSANVLPQLGGHGIDAGDSRILNAVFRNGNIYYAQTIGLGGAAFNPTRTAGQWVEVNTGGAFVQGGRIVDPTATSSNGGHWYAYPSIAVNKNSDVMVGFSEFASNHYPNAAYAVHMSTDAAGTMRDPVTLKAGEGNYWKQFTGMRNRWGDYSATLVDPADDTSFWTTQEYSRPTPAGCSTGPSITCGAWGTWWGKVLGGAPPPPSYTLTVSKAGSAPGAGTVTGNGINCGATCSASYPSGTVVTLNQSHPANRSTFAGWSGDCSGLGVCSVTMNGNRLVVASFNQKQTPPACIVPKVVGKKLRAAKSAIRARHCKVGKVSYGKSTKQKKGRVVGQKPRAGSHRANGAKVNLVVGRGPKR
jgi:PASTA domain-containing protein